MVDVTDILQAIERGEAHTSAELLPLVYDELRRLAAHKLAAANWLVHHKSSGLVGWTKDSYCLLVMSA